MNFTHCYLCKLSRRILLVKWDNTIQSGPLGCGTWKRWLYNVWRLVCSLKYNWKCPRLALLGFKERAASCTLLPPSVPSPRCGSPRHSRGFILHCLFVLLNPILSLQYHWGCTPSKTSSETFSLCSISLPVRCTYSLIFSIFSFIQPYDFHLTFSINSGWFMWSLVLSSCCLVANLRQGLHVSGLHALIMVFCSHRDK